MAAVSSSIEVVNLALDRLSAESITSFDDDNEPARVSNRAYDPTRKILLRAHPWNFAIKRQALSKLVTTPAFGYANEFQLPNDCLRVLNTNLHDYYDEYRHWRIEGQKLLTDVGTISIKYIADVEDITKWDSLAIDAFIVRLASAMAFSLTGEQELGKLLFEEYRLKLAEARSIDAQESSTEEWTEGTWLESRM